jgi:hypothetical protein
MEVPPGNLDRAGYAVCQILLRLLRRSNDRPTLVRGTAPYAGGQNVTKRPSGRFDQAKP